MNFSRAHESNHLTYHILDGIFTLNNRIIFSPPFQIGSECPKVVSSSRSSRDTRSYGENECSVFSRVYAGCYAPVFSSHNLLYKKSEFGSWHYPQFFVYLLFIIYNPQLKPLYKQQKAADMREKSHISRSYFLVKNLLHHQPER